MRKKTGPEKQDKNKKMIAVRMSPRALQILGEFTDRYPGMSQAGILEMGLIHLKKASDEELKDLVFEFIKGAKE
jgi:hypothetical protein